MFLNTMQISSKVSRRTLCLIPVQLGDRLNIKRNRLPQKYLKRLSQETGVSVPSVQRATKLLNLKPYKITVVHALHQPHPNKRLQFFNWVLEKVNSGEQDAK